MEHQGVLFANVLLVEDEPAHALLIERGVRSLVGALVTRTTVAKAREAISSDTFDLIISDLNLPDLRSEEAVRAIREVAPRVPLLVLTSSSTLGDGIAAMRAGASDFLVKNFDASFREVLQLVLSRLRGVLDAERERAQVTRDRDLLREAIENSNDGLAVAFRDGQVRYCNSGFHNFLSSFGVAGLSLLDISPESVVRGEEVLQKLREQIRDLEAGAIWTTELVHARDDEVAFDISIFASRDGSSDRPLVLWIRDIRERKRRERFQREILSTTTHDLKGPLGAISVSCDVLLESPSADERSHALLERISTAASGAIHLIEECLSMRRIEEGAFVMHPVLNEMAPVIERVVESFALTAKTRSVALSVEWEERYVMGCIDPLGCERVISNLLSNAIKFSQKGGEVVLRIARRAGGVVITVRDKGSGMEPSEAQGLFHRYARLSSHSRVAGSGLGLFIVKCIVSAHGGAIDVTSAVGKGTTFDVFFPDRPPCNERGEILCLDFA